MNEKVFIAKIYWLRPNQGCRKQGVPLHMKKYCPIVSVDGKKFFSGSTYGLLCYSFEQLSEYVSLSQIRFLNTDVAPDVLHIGANLELYEGTKKVADGEVIKNSNFTFVF